MTKIRFNTPTMSQELRDALVLLKDGIACLAKALGRLFNHGAHRFPYAYMFILAVVIAVPSVMSVMQARADRDSASRHAYELQQQIDSLQLVSERRTYAER